MPRRKNTLQNIEYIGQVLIEKERLKLRIQARDIPELLIDAFPSKFSLVIHFSLLTV